MATRRSVLRGTALTVASGVAGFVAARRSDAAKPRSASTAANAYGAPAADEGRLLVALDRVPTGGGVVLEDRRVVLTRDDSGEVRAFSSTCTHQGCTVSSVRGGRISCPCHGSAFDATTGEVVAGPARSALREVPVVVRAGEVFTG